MRLILSLYLLFFYVSVGLAQTIWNSNTITFNKVALEDADPITQHVILTEEKTKAFIIMPRKRCVLA